MESLKTTFSTSCSHTLFRGMQLISSSNCSHDLWLHGMTPRMSSWTIFLTMQGPKNWEIKSLHFFQGPTQAFEIFWVRFKAYQRNCSHHGFSDDYLMGIFFRDIDWRRYQMDLDGASEENFNTKSPEKIAKWLIKNLVLATIPKMYIYIFFFSIPRM